VLCDSTLEPSLGQTLNDTNNQELRKFELTLDLFDYNVHKFQSLDQNTYKLYQSETLTSACANYGPNYLVMSRMSRFVCTRHLNRRKVK